MNKLPRAWIVAAFQLGVPLCALLLGILGHNELARNMLMFWFFGVILFYLPHTETKNFQQSSKEKPKNSHQPVLIIINSSKNTLLYSSRATYERHNCQPPMHWSVPTKR